ncbi:hypothetical protein FisN_34Lh037 [Fistulifera solaris]|uniref:Uncharacterized protein n=1 Tax=Fistulifera solaris TaxID=1519565 RepID=A0A1Z5JHF5_FISSO|nr:hypothetical protein FisN_34Lh037 [Fistulifera solaris]|eukprot:GAX13435.1 hypothetical protein FisN_34Lh037 [Fistulifera solaris]
MNNNHHKNERQEPPQPRGHRRVRPSLPPSVVSLPGRISQPSDSQAIVYPYSQQSPESKRSASNNQSTMQQAASPWPTESHSKPFDYSRQPPSSVVPNLERIHPLKKVDPTVARQNLSIDTSYVEGDEFTALLHGMQDESYGAVESGSRRKSDMPQTSELVKKATSLAGESKRPPKRPMMAVPTTPDVSPRRSHRRHNSDNSRTAYLPVRARSLTNYEGSSLRPLPRTLSSSSLNNPPASRHHRRRSSNSVFSSVGSVMTDASMMTLVTDIEKSSLFAGYDRFTGQALFKLPISSVQISVEEHPNGEFYQVRENDQTFENYHHQGEDLVDARINHSSGPRYALPPTRYVIHAPPDLYRRMVDEVCRSSSLPCGIFFCGHHEDVAKPSLMIAVLVLLIVFGWMGLVAYIYRG